MAVLIEAISVVVRRQAIDSRLRGGWPAFVSEVPNRTFCTDGEIARVGFMSPSDVKAYVERLTSLGLVFMGADGPQDIAVVDQCIGPTSNCEWLFFEAGQTECGSTVATCRLHDGTLDLATPEGWSFDQSLSREHGFVPSGEMGERLVLVGHENGMDVYRDLSTGREVYIGRAGK